MKKLLSLVLAVILALSLGTQVLALDLGVIQIGGPGEESSHAEPGSMEIKLNDTLAIDGWGEITLTKVEFRDSFSLFIDEGWWEDYYAGMEADYLVIYLDIIIDFDIEDRQELFDHIEAELKQVYPQYRFNLIQDIDV